MKKFIITLVTVVLFTQFIGCTTNNKVSTQSDNSIENENRVSEASKIKIPENIIETIAQNRDFSSQITEDDTKEFKKFLYKYDSFKDEPSLELIKWNSENLDEKKKESISIDQALYDVNFFFDMLRYSYAGYEYFGGDETFGNAKENIIEELGNFNENIDISMLSQLIKNNMGFIQDSHFRIGYYGVAKRYKYISNNEVIFHKDGDKLYTNLNGENYYLDSVNNSDYNSYIKPSLDEEGNIIYQFGIMDTSDTKQINILLKSKNTSKEENIVLSYKSMRYSKYVGYKTYTIDNIPIIVNRRMYKISESDTELDNFLEHAEEFKDNDIIILDIRGNIGGTSIYPMGWIKKFTEKEAVSPWISSKLKTAVNNKLALNYLMNNSYESYREERIKEVEKELGEMVVGDTLEGWTEVNFVKPQKINSDTLVVVLTDNGVASCGEEFVSYLKSLNNVIFIGTNTGGAMLISDNATWFLPNSKLRINSGTGIILNPNLENIDGRGYYPDLWVNSHDIVNRVIKFINKYDMRSIKIPD